MIRILVAYAVVGLVAIRVSTSAAILRFTTTSVHDSIAAHFAAIAMSRTPPQCMPWSDTSMRVGGSEVTAACVAWVGDTSTYYYKTAEGDLFAAGRDVQLRRGNAFEASARAESELLAVYGMPVECKASDWRFLTNVKRVLWWARSEYSVMFQTTVGPNESRADGDQPMRFAIQIARNRRACGDLVPRPSRE